MVFSTFILRYVESKFTLLTYLMENNTVITVISYVTKGLNNSKTKQKPIPTTHNKSNKSRALIWLKGVNFSGVLFCGVFFLRELIFADRGQSAKFSKIRTRKIFMLLGILRRHAKEAVVGAIGRMVTSTPFLEDQSTPASWNTMLDSRVRGGLFYFTRGNRCSRQV